jgi:hypothetical protein
LQTFRCENRVNAKPSRRKENGEIDALFLGIDAIKLQRLSKTLKSLYTKRGFAIRPAIGECAIIDLRIHDGSETQRSRFRFIPNNRLALLPPWTALACAALADGCAVRIRRAAFGRPACILEFCAGLCAIRCAFPANLERD